MNASSELTDLEDKRVSNAKRRTAWELAKRLRSHVNDDEPAIKSLVVATNLNWTDYEGTAVRRLFLAICACSADQIRTLVDQAFSGIGEKKVRPEIERLRDNYLEIPGVPWNEEISKDFDGKCPYQGMSRFVSSKGFYGRDQLSRDIYQRATETPLLFVQGASGSGKSSVLAAGVAPQWRREHGESTVLSIRADRNPFERLPGPLMNLGWDTKRAKVYEHSSQQVLVELAADIGEGKHLLTVDQFEQTLAADSEDRQPGLLKFLAALTEFAHAAPANLHVIVCLRSDFWNRLEIVPELFRIADDHFIRVLSLDEDGICEAVERPAAEHGVNVDEEIVDDVVQHVAQRSGMLPLMQDVLEQLWNNQPKLDSIRRLTYEVYLALGGVMGALSRKMDGLVDRFGQDSIRRILLQTVQVDEDPKTPPISRKGRRSLLAPADRPLVEQLIDTRVLVAPDSNDPIEAADVFELPHEALIQKWGKFGNWINDDRRALHQVRMLLDSVQIWHSRRTAPNADQARIDEEYCWRGGRLEDAEHLVRDDFSRLGFSNQDEKVINFLDVSRRLETLARDRTLTESKAREEVAVYTALIAFFALFAVVLFWKKTSDDLAESERRVDLSKVREAALASDRNNADLAMDILDTVADRHRYTSTSQGKPVPDFAWHYIYRQCREGLFTLWGHTGAITSVAFSADGQRILTGSEDKTARVWNARTGQSVLELKGHTSDITSVAFSADGQRILTGSGDSTARVWDAHTGQSVLELKEHIKGVTSVAFSADGQRILTGSGDSTARVWDARTGQSVLELKGHIGYVMSVAFSADGQRILTGSLDRTARVWDARTGQSVLKLKGHTNAVRSVAFSADGQRILTGSGDQTARVSDARTGQSSLELKGHMGIVTSVAFSADGQRILTGSGDQTARVWDARTGQSVLELKGHTSYITSVAFSADGQRILTGSEDQTARVWDARTGESVLELKGHTSYVKSVAFSADGQRILTGSGDQTARVWDALTGQSVLELKGHTSYVTSVAFSADRQRILSGSGDQTARVWDALTGQSVHELKGHTNAVASVAFSADGQRILTSSWDQTARVWDAPTGQPLLELKGHIDYVTSAAFSADGRRILTGSGDQTARVWDARTGQSVLELEGHTRYVTSVALSADGQRILTGSGDQTARVWDAQIGQSVLELKGHIGYVTSVVFSADGRRILTGCEDQTARVWDAETGKFILELKGHTMDVTSVAFSADGQRMLTGSGDETARVWDAQTGKSILELKGHTMDVTSAAFSADGQRILTGSRDQVARVWDARTGQSVLEFKGRTGYVTSVAFSADGQRIFTKSNSQTLVWDAKTGQILSDAPPPSFPEDKTVHDDRQLIRFGRRVVIVPVTIPEQIAEDRRLRTSPQPDFHRYQARVYRGTGEEFAADVHDALEQQAKGQLLVDEGKAEQAKAYFEKARQMWPKPIEWETPPADALEAIEQAQPGQK